MPTAERPTLEQLRRDLARAEDDVVAQYGNIQREYPNASALHFAAQQAVKRLKLSIQQEEQRLALERQDRLQKENERSQKALARASRASAEIGERRVREWHLEKARREVFELKAAFEKAAQAHLRNIPQKRLRDEIRYLTPKLTR